MESLKPTFKILGYCGLWRPLNWPSTKIRGKLYNVYGLLMMLLFVAFVVAPVIKLKSPLDDIDAFAHDTFIILTLIADCGKGINIVAKRNDIIRLFETLGADPCRAKTEQEFAIERKFNRTIRLYSLRYIGLVTITVIIVVLSSMIENVPRKTLPYATWLPQEYIESWIGYSIAYSHQIYALIFGASVSVAFDTLVPGLMIHTQAQLNILMHRFNEIPTTLLEIVDTTEISSTSNNEERQPNVGLSSVESSLLSRQIQHHLTIFKFAEKSNDIFTVMIFLQYAISTSILCMSLIRVSKLTPFSPAFTSAFVAMTEMSIQIFIFCYYGDNVSIESLKVSDAIYEMDWQALSKNARRSLVTIMARSLRPITFTTIHVITLNLESFKSLVKLSYSIYNVL